MELLTPVMPERAHHNHIDPLATTCTDLPFIPGSFVHSTSCQHSSTEQSDSSPLTPTLQLPSLEMSHPSPTLSTTSFLPLLSYLFNSSLYPAPATNMLSSTLLPTSWTTPFLTISSTASRSPLWNLAHLFQTLTTQQLLQMSGTPCLFPLSHPPHHPILYRTW